MNPAPPVTRILPFERSVMLHVAGVVWPACLANDEQGNFDSMADRVNGGAKNKILKTAMPVRRHNDKIRLHFSDSSGDLLGWIFSVPYNDINTNVLIAQRGDDVGKIILSLGDFRSG